MRRLFVSLLCLFLSLPLFAAYKLSSIAGSVAVNRGAQWETAQKGMVLAPGDKVKTLEESRAVVTVDDTTRLWVRPGSEFELASRDNDSIINILAGKIRARVRLFPGKKFIVKTPVCVASVRGTEFIFSFENSLAVIEGKVEFSDAGMARIVEVFAGETSALDPLGQVSTPRPMTDEELAAQGNEWEGFDALEQEAAAGGGTEEKEAGKDDKKEELKDELADLRQELRDAVGDIRTDIDTARELTNEIKEADLTAGRTLKDVHGNIVRVEQHLLRPDDKTLQIVSLTKRSNYNYSDRFNWNFSVPNTARLDIMDVTMTMNKALPEQITEWPAYISSQGDALHPDKVEVSMTNQADEITFSGKWKLKGDLDGKGEALADDGLVMDSSINGWKVDAAYQSGDEGKSADGADDSQMWGWGISPETRLVKDGEGERFVRLYTEAYGINNGGSILSINDFTSTSENPFTILKQVASEQVMFCRNLDGTDFLLRGNLDLVITPDLAVAVAQKLATQIGSLTSKTDPDTN